MTSGPPVKRLKQMSLFQYTNAKASETTGNEILTCSLTLRGVSRIWGYPWYCPWKARASRRRGRWGPRSGYTLYTPSPENFCNSSFQMVHFHAIWRRYFYV